MSISANQTDANELHADPPSTEEIGASNPSIPSETATSAQLDANPPPLASPPSSISVAELKQKTPLDSPSATQPLIDDRKSVKDVSYYRHPSLLRVTHWLTAFSIFSLLLSGFVIFGNHARLYWGEGGFFGDPALLSFSDKQLDLLTWLFADNGEARSTHFLSAWVLVGSCFTYVVSGVVNGHFLRDLLPTRTELGLKHILTDLANHVRLQFPVGEAARHYNVVQKMAYLGVMFILIPLMILTGFTMSPSITATYPELFLVFGGRQSARTIHFFCAFNVAMFILIHLAMVVLAGFKNHMRAMVTGWYVLPIGKTHEKPPKVP